MYLNIKMSYTFDTSNVLFICKVYQHKHICIYMCVTKWSMQIFRLIYRLHLLLTLLYSLDSRIVVETNDLAIIQCRRHSLRSCGFNIKSD